MKIYTPVKDFNGIRASVRFVKGVGETNNPQLIEWFKQNGYVVEKGDKPIEKSLEKCDEILDAVLEKCSEPDFEAMTPIELREWMRENGYGSKIKNIRNKEKLLEILRG